MRRPIKLEAFLFNENQTNSIRFSANLSGNTKASLRIGNAIYNKPADQLMSISGIMTLHDSTVTIGTSEIVIGELSFQTAGIINGIGYSVPSLDIKAWIHNPAPIHNILALFNQGQFGQNIDQITGNLRGGVHIIGSVRQSYYNWWM